MAEKIIEDIVTDENYYMCEGARITFTYDSDYDGYSLRDSEGECSKLMIPDKINGKYVKELQADFFDVTGYDEIVVNKENRYFTVADGVLFSEYLMDNGARLCLYPPEKKDEVYEVPKGTFLIADCSVKNRYLKKIYMQEGIEQVGDYAFQCSSLEEVYIPETFKVFWFCPFPFKYSERLKKIFYRGTREQWDKIENEHPGDIFKKAEIVFEADISFGG